MAVVINLDAARLARQVERLLQTSEQLMLRRSIGELAAQRLARVGHRVRDQFPLLATLRHRDIDLAAGLGAKRCRKQRALGNVVREQNAAGRRLVVVELRHERTEHLAGLQRAVGLRKIRAIAPVLPGPEEEHFNAIEAAVLMDREHVGVLDAARVDALRALHCRQRGEAVAVDRGPFEVEFG